MWGTGLAVLWLKKNADKLSCVRVLIVDDRDYIRRGLKAYLSDEPGIQVWEAQNGGDAIAKAKSLRPDVILMDISMPIVDGLRATKVIHQEQPNVQIITISMNSMISAKS